MSIVLGTPLHVVAWFVLDFFRACNLDSFSVMTPQGQSARHKLRIVKRRGLEVVRISEQADGRQKSPSRAACRLRPNFAACIRSSRKSCTTSGRRYCETRRASDANERRAVDCALLAGLRRCARKRALVLRHRNDRA